MSQIQNLRKKINFNNQFVILSVKVVRKILSVLKSTSFFQKKKKIIIKDDYITLEKVEGKHLEFKSDLKEI